MKIENFKTPIHLACNTNDLRPAMWYVFFEGGYAYATNGRLAIKQSLCKEYCAVRNKDKLNLKCIHKDAFAKIMQFPIAIAKENGIECTDGNITVLFNYGPEDIKRPNLEKAVIKKFKVDTVKAINLNIEYFALAKRCLYHEEHKKARVEFQGVEKALRVTYPDFPNQEAYIMPFAWDEK